jgi:hypothetical protein
MQVICGEPDASAGMNPMSRPEYLRHGRALGAEPGGGAQRPGQPPDVRVEITATCSPVVAA